VRLDSYRWEPSLKEKRANQQPVLKIVANDSADLERQMGVE
jgi:hypothetical protein